MDILAQTDRQLFTGDATTIKKEFHRLSMMWHPDRNHDPLAAKVMAHITEMYNRALHRDILPRETFVRQDGSKFQMEYLKTTSGQGSTIYLGKSRVAYMVEDQSLATKAINHRWKYSSPNMEKEMKRFLPEFIREEKLQSGSLLIYNKTPDQIPMNDLMTIEGTIDPLHVMWMISRMMNLLCYLEWSKLAHCGIASEFLLVSPEYHSVSLTGPVLYGTSFDHRPSSWSLPSRTVGVAPWLKNKSEKADQRIDQQLVRQTALELLGDRGGARLKNRGDIRKEVVDWLLSPPAKTSQLDYANWEKCLGERKFVQYPKTIGQLYEGLV